MKRGLVILAALGAMLVAPPVGSAAPPFAPCGPAGVGLQCATISVPVDYPGATLGQIPLYIEQLPAVGTPKGVMVMMAGGPGQASAGTFELGARASYWRSYFPGYTLVAYDDRGTGNSGALGCPFARTISQCGNAIPNRTFYSTRDHGEDIESVRLALGVDKVGLFGVSYGTKHALAYAVEHPTHVERLLLDSEVLPSRDPFSTESLRTIVPSVNRICTVNACPGIPAGIGDRFATLANQLQANPITATLNLAPALGPFPVEIDGTTMISLAYESDLSSAISSLLPSAIDSALAGSPQTLERLAFLDAVSNASQTGDVNIALFFATNCADGPFPWQPNDSPEARLAALTTAVAALPAGSYGPFGPWALQTGTAFACVDWPTPSGNAALPNGPWPDVPVLILAGDRDIRTPVVNANAVAALFPRGRVVTVPGAGHSVLNHSECSATATRTWLNGGTPPSVCTPYPLLVAPLGQLRKTVSAMPPLAKFPGLPGRTLSALVQTLRDAENVWLLVRRSQTTVLGLAGGRVTPDPQGGIRLQAFSSVAPIAVTGKFTLKMDPFGSPTTPLSVVGGTVTVAGRGLPGGTFKIAGNRLTGKLGGRAVSIAF